MLKPVNFIVEFVGMISRRCFFTEGERYNVFAILEEPHSVEYYLQDEKGHYIGHYPAWYFNTITN